MAMIKMTPFGGLLPKIGKRILPDSNGQTANNVKIYSGELRLLCPPGWVHTPTVGANPTTIFKARTGAAQTSWFAWADDVNCVRVPLAVDVESRFCWTGDGIPKTGWFSGLDSSGDGPAVAGTYALGIPTPVTAPGVTGQQATVTISLASPGIVSWSGHHFAAGAAVVFTTTGSLPATIVAGTTYYVVAGATLIDGTSFAVSATVGGTAINTASASTATTTGTAMGAYSNTSGSTATATTRFYCYTFMSKDGEESAPSPISTELTGKGDGTWLITGMDTAPTNSGAGTATATRFTNTASAKHWLRVGEQVYFGGAPSTPRTVTAIYSASAFDVTGASIVAETAWTRVVPWNTTTMTKNLYRTTGTRGAFQLVNATGIAVATTTYTDSLLDSAIAGDDLISTGWEPPPVGLTCLTVHASGALIGMVGNLLCMSEPLQPHAWPQAYQLSSGYNGVGVETFGSSVVMATAGTPFVAAGVEPASMTGENYKGMYPCLSKNSVVSVGDGVLYASKYGMVYVGAAGVTMFSDQFYTRDEWEPLNPDTMICETANGRIYVAYITDSLETRLLIFDGPNLTTATVSISALYADESSGDLYVGTSEGIALWDDSAEVPLASEWRSKEWVFPVPINLGAAKIEFDAAIDPATRTAILAQIAAIAAANAAYLNANPVPVAYAPGGAFNDEEFNGQFINGSNLVVPPAVPAANVVSITLYSGDRLLFSRTVTSDRVFRINMKGKLDHYSIQVGSQCTVKEVRVAEIADELRLG